MLKNTKNQTVIKLGLDAALTIAFLALLKPFLLTGLVIHEWLGLAIGISLVIHAIWHRQWIAGITRKLSSRLQVGKQLPGELPLKTCLYYALDASLILNFLTIIGSGIVMSRVVLPSLGLQGVSSDALPQIHKVVSYLTLFLLGVKLVIHGRWIVNALKHLIGKSRSRSNRRLMPLAIHMPVRADENTER